MAARKPLVLNSGQFEELQSGDTLDASITEKDVVTLTNDNAGSMSLGEVVYISSDDGCDLAQADAVGTADAIGLVADASIASSASGTVQTDGILVSAGSFTAGDIMYLDATTAGSMTSTPPSSSGEFIVELGKAINTTDLEITIRRRIKLG